MEVPIVILLVCKVFVNAATPIQQTPSGYITPLLSPKKIVTNNYHNIQQNHDRPLQNCGSTSVVNNIPNNIVSNTFTNTNVQNQLKGKNNERIVEVPTITSLSSNNVPNLKLNLINDSPIHFKTNQIPFTIESNTKEAVLDKTRFFENVKFKSILNEIQPKSFTLNQRPISTKTTTYPSCTSRLNNSNPANTSPLTASNKPNFKSVPISNQNFNSANAVNTKQYNKPIPPLNTIQNVVVRPKLKISGSTTTSNPRKLTPIQLVKNIISPTEVPPLNNVNIVPIPTNNIKITQNSVASFNSPINSQNSQSFNTVTNYQNLNDNIPWIAQFPPPSTPVIAIISTDNKHSTIPFMNEPYINYINIPTVSLITDTQSFSTIAPKLPELISPILSSPTIVEQFPMANTVSRVNNIVTTLSSDFLSSILPTSSCNTGTNYNINTECISEDKLPFLSLNPILSNPVILSPNIYQPVSYKPPSNYVLPCETCWCNAEPKCSCSKSVPLRKRISEPLFTLTSISDTFCSDDLILPNLEPITTGSSLSRNCESSRLCLTPPPQVNCPPISSKTMKSALNPMATKASVLDQNLSNINLLEELKTSELVFNEKMLNEPSLINVKPKEKDDMNDMLKFMELLELLEKDTSADFSGLEAVSKLLDAI